MDKIFKVAAREYVETVKTKTFLLTMLFTPLFLAGIILLVGRTGRAIQGGGGDRMIGVIDLSGALEDELKRVFDSYNKPRHHRRIYLKVYPPEELQTKLQELGTSLHGGNMDGLLVLDEHALKGGTSRFHTQRLTDVDFFFRIRDLINQAATNQRLREHNLSPELIASLQQSIPLEQVDLTTGLEGEREMVTVMMVPFFFVFMMFTSVFGTGQGMLTSVIEEKNSRVMEVLLSSLTPLELMAGKIVGLALVGLTMVTVWVSVAYATAWYRGMAALLSSDHIGYFIVYYILGFFLISSILAAIGSVCNTTKEAQTLMMPISMLLIVPMVAWFYIVQQPEGLVARIMSFIPPITPMVMILRIAACRVLSWWEIFATLVLLGVSVVVTVLASAKIFRTGILMYGKPPTLREMLRWIRYK